MATTEAFGLLTVDAAEVAVIATLMLDPAAYAEVAAVVSESDFLSPFARTTFAVVSRLVADGTRADAVTVLDTLSREHATEAPKQGWEPYLAALSAEVPSAAGAVDYARIVLAWSRRRGLRGVAAELGDDASTGDPDVLIERTLEQLLALQDCGDSRQAWSARGAVDEFVSGMGDETRAVLTGLHSLDAVTGGLRRGDLIVVAGRPSMGKSTLAQNIAEHSAAEGRTVLLFSIEMSAASIAGRMIAGRSGVPLARLRSATLSDAEVENVAAVADEIRGLPIHTCDLAALSLAKVHAIARQTKALRGLDLVIVDYLQLMETGDAETRERAVAHLSGGMKRLARDLDVPVVCLSQLNRSLESRADKRPMLSDLRDSGAIEQDADTVLMLYRPWVYDRSADPCAAEIIVAKQRNGPICSVDVRFHGDRFRFADTGDLA